jgi:rRNA maturation endonuclease Nob1
MPDIICEGCHKLFWWNNTIERRFCHNCLEKAKIIRAEDNNAISNK